MWVMASASASAASAGFGGASRRRIRVTIGADLRLVRAAAAGDGGLDLAGGVQRDRHAPSCRRDEGDAAGLGGAHDGAGVGPGEDPLDGDRVGGYSSSQASMPFSIVTSRCATGSSALVRSTFTSTSVSGRPTDPSTTPMPQRVRPGSIPSTRIWSLPSEHLFGEHANRDLLPPGVRHAGGGCMLLVTPCY